jgi:hypothetical protein
VVAPKDIRPRRRRKSNLPEHMEQYMWSRGDADLPRFTHAKARRFKSSCSEMPLCAPPDGAMPKRFGKWATLQKISARDWIMLIAENNGSNARRLNCRPRGYACGHEV